MPARFTEDLFKFLRGLERNNDREWFNENKPKYEEHIKGASLEFIEEFAPYLDTISRQFDAIPKATGGSLFRIYRDTRFAKDKTPYKTHVGIHFRHRRAKDAHAPGFYLHLEPKGCFVGVGIWHPEPKDAGKIRQGIAEDTKGWKKAAYDKKFARMYRLAGDSLKRPPRGFDADHEYIDDLKRKDFIAVADLKDEDVLKKGFITKFASVCQTASPFQGFLCKAMGLKY